MIKSKKLKSNIIVVLFTLIVALVSAAIVGQQQTAYAETVNFNQVGASVRMGDHKGIRFVATIDKVNENSKYYVMIIPESWVNTYKLNESGNKDYYDVLYKAGKRSEIDVKEGETVSMLVMQSEPTLQKGGAYKDLYLIRGSIVNIKYDNSNTKFFGVAFEEKADGTRVYADGQKEYSYRSITNVASAALNDADADYGEENIASLNKMVKDAYNVSLGKQENEQVDLPEMSVHSDINLSVQNGSTYQATVKNMPDIGIDVKWRLTRSGAGELLSTIDENGKITVADQDINCFGYAKVLGNEIKFIVNPTAKPAEGVLEDFATSSMRYNFGRGGVVKDGQVPYTETLNDLTGVTANGIAGIYVSRSASIDNKDATFRFALSYEDLKKSLNGVTSVTVRMMVGTYYRSGKINDSLTLEARKYDGDSTEKGLVKFVGREFAVPHNTWVDLTVTKAEFLNFFKGATEEEKLNDFAVSGANNGKGIAGFTVCEKYTINGYPSDCEMLFDAVYTDKATVAPLESAASVSRINVNVKDGTYLDSKKDTNNVTVNNVIYVQEYQNYGVNMKFNMTAEELKNITSLTFKVLLEDPKSEKTSYVLRYNRGGGSDATGLVQTSVKCGEWVEITYTKEQLCQKFLYPYGNATKNENCSADGGWTDFCNAFCTTGDLTHTFLSGVNATNPPIIYIADVTFNYT